MGFKINTDFYAKFETVFGYFTGEIFKYVFFSVFLSLFGVGRVHLDTGDVTCICNTQEFFFPRLFLENGKLIPHIKYNGIKKSYIWLARFV